jgi:hypothetical protein
LTSALEHASEQARSVIGSRIAHRFSLGLVAIGMIAVAVVYLWPGLIAHLNIYDEGLIVYGAVRVMDGQIPYRDFWTQYSPAQLYTLAGLFKLFGANILVERVWDIVIRAGLAFVIFLLDGSLDSLPFFAPFLIYALAAIVAVVKLGSNKAEAREKIQAWGILIVVLFGLFGFNQARVRSDTIHTVQFFLPAALLLPVLMRGFPRIAPLTSYLVTSIGVVFFVALAIKPVEGYMNLLNSRPAAERAARTTLPIGRPGQMSTEQAFAALEIQHLTEKGDKIYIGLTRHDRIFANDVMLYFLAERHSPTRYHELHPGLVNTEPVQREMIADIERSDVKVVVLTDMFEGAREPNESDLSSGVTLLDDYIEEHYRFAQQIGSYRILKRRE